jgi:hypothetical protein
MRADGPGATAEITLTPCISLNAEKAGTDVAVMTVGNSPGSTELPPYQNNSQSIPNPDKLSRSQRSGLRLVDPTARREIPLAGFQPSLNPVLSGN